MANTIPEYLAQQNITVSNRPRAGQGLIPSGTNVINEAIAGAVQQVGKVATDAANIEAAKQAIRDNVTLAELKGQLDDYEFNTQPDPSKVKTIGDFNRQENEYHKQWESKGKTLPYGQSRAVQEQFGVYIEEHRITAKRNYRNKIRPMEKAYAEESIKTEWINRLKVNVANPVAQKMHLEALVDNFSGYLDPATVLTLNKSMDRDIEGFNLQFLMNANPDAALQAVESTQFHTEAEKNTLRSQARSHIARIEREAAIKLAKDREETMASLTVNYWDGKLKDPQIVSAFLKAGKIDLPEAKALHNAMLNPEPPKTTNEAYVASMYAKDGIANGTETRESALKKVMGYVGQLSPTDGRGFIDDIFGEHDSMNAFWNRESQSYMEKQILEVATMSGILYGSGEQQAMSAKALLAFDTAKKEAAAAGKPLVGRELLIKAHEIMMPFRDKPIIEGEKMPQSLKNLSPQDEIRMSRGLPPMNAGQAAIEAFKKVVAASKVPRPKTKEDYDKLKSGDKYIDPAGVERTKK